MALSYSLTALSEGWVKVMQPIHAIQAGLAAQVVAEPLKERG